MNKDEQITALRKALAGLGDHLEKLIMLFGTSGDALTDFEEVAAAFHKDTGKLRPGKDAPVPEMAATRDEYNAWVDGINVEAQKALHEARQALVTTEPEAKQPEPWETEHQIHIYHPSWQHMGDCKICGRIKSDPIHSTKGKADDN